MTEAIRFRQYAKETMNWSYRVKDAGEKRALTELACIWACAAMISDRFERGCATAGTPLMPKHLGAVVLQVRGTFGPAGVAAANDPK
jgi:hypothetical protein